MRIFHLHRPLFCFTRVQACCVSPSILSCFSTWNFGLSMLWTSLIALFTHTWALHGGVLLRFCRTAAHFKIWWALLVSLSFTGEYMGNSSPSTRSYHFVCWYICRFCHIDYFTDTADMLTEPYIVIAMHTYVLVNIGRWFMHMLPPCGIAHAVPRLDLFTDKIPLK